MAIYQPIGRPVGQPTDHPEKSRWRQSTNGRSLSILKREF